MRDTVRANPEITVVMEFSDYRQYDGRQLLAWIEAEGFPLRCVNTDEVKELLADRCLSEGPEWMLFLRRT